MATQTIDKKPVYIGNGKNHPTLSIFIGEKEKELKPCPFCGCDAEIDNTWTASYSVECTGCEAKVGDPDAEGGEGTEQSHQKSVEGAVNAWNRRV